MKKFIFFLFFIIFFNLFSNEIKKDIDISNMPLSDVAGILSKETGLNIITSQEAKNIIIDAYFDQGDEISTILYVLADAYNLDVFKTKNTTLLSLKTERKTNRAKLIIKVLDSYTNEVLSNVNLQLKDREFFYGTTNKDGLIIIDDIPKSTYLAKFSKDNFETKGEIIDLTKSLLMLDVYLKPLSIKNSNSNYSHSENLSFFENNGKLLYTETFSLYNVPVEDIKKVLSDGFGDLIKLSSLNKLNKLTVIAERDILENVRKIIREMDKNPRQVRISSEILDISNNLFEELGFNWVHQENVRRTSDPAETKPNSLSANILTSASAVASGNVYGSQIAIFRQFHNKTDILNVSLNLLEATNDLIVSSMPTITISSGEEGEFKVTEEVVVGEKIEKNNNHKKDANIYFSEPVFKEAGLILKVKPLIKDDDEIILDISIELSNFRFKKNLLKPGEINSGTFNSEGGSKVGRSISTTVRVKNGDTILLGGLKKAIKQSLESKVPILGDIPLINFFFKSTSKRDENSDMYIKLKVEIENL